MDLQFPTDKKYKLFYADPPWDYEKYGWDRSSQRRQLYKKKITGLARYQYETMSIKDICALPVKKIAHDDAILFLWTTWPVLKQSFEVIESWGFEYKTIGFIWVKTTTNSSKPSFGLGTYTKSNSEPCLLCTRGHVQKYIESDSVSSVVISTRREHSRKPDIVRQRILKLCGNISRLELFARTKIHGWDVWGNDDKLNLDPLESFSL